MWAGLSKIVKRCRKASICSKSIAFAVAVFALINLPEELRGQYAQLTYPANAFAFSANPFYTGNDCLTNLIRTAPDGTTVYVWDETNQVFSPPSVFHGNWSSNYPLPVGRGFIVRATSTFTNLYIGEIAEGTLVNPIPGSNRLALVASIVPQGASLSDLNFPGSDGDNVSVFDTTAQNFLDVFTYFNGFGWFDPTRATGTNGPTVAFGTSFFVQHAGANTNWVRTFFISNIAPRSSGLKTSTSNVESLTIQNSTVAIESTANCAKPYDVQFSIDGTSWKTVATDVKGRKWTGRFSGKPYGFYRLVKHSL